MWRLLTAVLATAALAAGAAAQTQTGAPVLKREPEASAAPAARTGRPATGRPQVRGLTGPQATTVNLTENECTTLGGVVHTGPEVGDVCLSGKVCRHVDERDKEHLVCIAKAK